MVVVKEKEEDVVVEIVCTRENREGCAQHARRATRTQGGAVFTRNEAGSEESRDCKKDAHRPLTCECCT